MQWFKHYTNVDDSNYISHIRAELGLKGYARYWILLEMMGKKFDGISTDFVFSAHDLKHKLEFHRDSDMENFLTCLSLEHSSPNQVPIMSHRSVNQTIIISTSILLELQGRDFKKARSGRSETAPKIKDKRDKNICTQTQSVGHSFDFEALYKLFPKRSKGSMKKKTGMDRLKKKITTPEKYETLKRAVLEVKRMVECGDQDKEYLIMWSTFANSYEDYLPENNEKAEKSIYDTY